jgi:hypothetical protein
MIFHENGESMKRSMLLLLVFAAIVLIMACEVGVRTKVDSTPSKQSTFAPIYGTTKEACTYEIAPDGIITVTAGKCPVSDDEHSLFTEEDGCTYAITQRDKTLVTGSCNQHPTATWAWGKVTTDLIHGADGCDYALARNGRISKIPGSCLGGKK